MYEKFDDARRSTVQLHAIFIGRDLHSNDEYRGSKIGCAVFTTAELRVCIFVAEKVVAVSNACFSSVLCFANSQGINILCMSIVMIELNGTHSIEIIMVQEMLYNMQLQVDEEKDMAFKEHEADQNSNEETFKQEFEAKVSVNKELEAGQKATEEVCTQKVECHGEETIVASRKVHNDAQERNMEVSKKVQDAEIKFEQLQAISTFRRMAELQKMLNQMQSKVRETIFTAIEEQELSRKSNEEAFREKLELIANVAHLEALLLTKEEAIDAANKEHTKAENRNIELLEKVEDYETKFEQLHDTVERLEEKVANLESENLILRQQADENSQRSKALHRRSKTTIFQRASQNGNFLNGERRLSLDMTSIFNTKEPESEEKLQRSLNENQQQNQELLIKSISQDLGFVDGRPTAACLIYKCLLHWRSFEVENTSIFDRIIDAIGSSIKVQGNSGTLLYWLSNSCTLLVLLQRTLKASGSVSPTPQKRRTPSSLFERMSQGVLSSSQSAGLPFLNGRLNGGLSDLRKVEAKYPALLFKQQINAFLVKIYGMIRDNLKKEIAPFLGLCIQAPQTSDASLDAQSRENAMTEQAPVAHWQGMVKLLTNYLNMLKTNHVPPFLIHKVLEQTFSYINVQLFNSLLLRKECCSFSNGEYLKAGLSELEQWCCSSTEEYSGSSWDELKHIWQAVGFLVIHQKQNKTLKEITNELCPVLSIQQLYKICTMYFDDKYDMLSVSSEVVSTMRAMMAEDDSNNEDSSSFLLDDDVSIPFSEDEISKSVLVGDVPDIDVLHLLHK